MTDSSDPSSVEPAASVTCRFAWCAGRFCTNQPGDERFHFAEVASHGHDGDHVGVELVCNDDADGTTGPLVDITLTEISPAGVSMTSTSLPPLLALRHGEAVIRAALTAISSASPQPTSSLHF